MAKSEHWSEVVKKAMAYDLILRVEANPEKETYTAEEVIALVMDYMQNSLPPSED